MSGISKAKDFAETYNGYIVENRRTKKVGIVSGYYINGPFVFMEWTSGQSYDTDYISHLTAWRWTRDIPQTYNGQITWWYSGIEELVIIGSPPKLSNTPDNCDECGAIGEEECKSTCPNKGN